VFIVWLCLMVLFVGFIVFFDRYGEYLAVRAWEQYPPNSYDAGMKYLERGQLKEAADAFEVSLEYMAGPGAHEPAWRVRDAKLNLGKIYYQLGQYDKAVPFLKHFAESAPGLDEGIPLYYLGETYLRLGDKEKAVEAFRLTTEWNFDPISAIAFFRLGELAAEAGDYNGAVENLNMAITLDADEALTPQMWERASAIALHAMHNTGGLRAAMAREIAGICKYRLNDFAACVEELQAALSAGRDTARVHYFMAKAYEAQGMNEKVQEHRARIPSGRVAIKGQDMIHTFGSREGDAWILMRNGKLRYEVFLANRIQNIEVVAKGASADFVSARMVVLLAGERVGVVETTDAGFERYIFRASVSKERSLLEIEFTNDYRDPETGEDRNLYVAEVAIDYAS